MRTTTFNQSVDGKNYTITLPIHRVDAVINRVDNLIDNRKFKRALEVLKPFFTEQAISILHPTSSLTSIDTASIIEKYRSEGRGEVVKQLVGSGKTRAAAYYHARKAGL